MTENHLSAALDFSDEDDARLETDAFSSLRSGHGLWYPVDRWPFPALPAGFQYGQPREIPLTSAVAGPSVTRGTAEPEVANEVVSQGDHAMGTDAARAKYGLDGSGVKVGVISDSFDLMHHAERERKAGELPADMRILKEGEYGFDEGDAMAQIIHDVAPGASILFSAGGQTVQTMAQSIRDLAAAGAKVIVDDLFYQNEPTYQDSAINQAISEVTAQGVIYITSAGNHGNSAYGAPFKAAAAPTVIDGKTVQLHEFAPGQDYISITIPAYTYIQFALQWSDAYRSISPEHGAKSDLDFYFYNDQEEFLFKISNPNIGGDPIEQIAYATRGVDEVLHVKVGLVDGPPPDEFRFVALRNGQPVYFESLASNADSGTLYGHAAARDAISVGAVGYRDTPAYGAAQPWSEPFSSVGPARFTYDVHGNKMPVPDVRLGPAFMAPDDGDNTFFGPDTDGDGFPNFGGTSAAAPHAAGLAALMLQANPRLTSPDIRSLLQDSAIDMDDFDTRGFDRGFDAATGAGFIQATALDFAVTGVIDNPRHNPVVTGTHLDDRIIGWGGEGTVPNRDAGASAVMLYGYAGNDLIEGGWGSDTLDGGDGADRMRGQGGDDRYIVDSSSDVVVEVAGEGIDTVLSSVSYVLAENAENLVLTGGNPNSAIGNAADNRITGNVAGNLMVGNGGNDTLDGGDGDDTLIGDIGNDRLIGGRGNDRMHAAGGKNILSGGDGADQMTAGDGDDTIQGGDGDDSISANGGNNRIDAGAGNDMVTAGNGSDVIVGGAGNDTIYANGGDNIFQLGGIADAFSDGDDQIWTGNGADTYVLLFADGVGNAAGFGRDTINGFRLAEGDSLFRFEPGAERTYEPISVSRLVGDGTVSGMRSSDGGDLILTFDAGQAAQSSLTLKWFFWDNGGALSSSERSAAFGSQIGKSELLGILQDILHDESGFSVDQWTAAHHFSNSGFALI